MIYLDCAATTPVLREVLEAMWPFLTDEFGNPSSQHEMGARARVALADSRARIATILGLRAGEIVFTSGATEADNLAIKGIALARPRGRHIVTSTIEHPAVLNSCDYLQRFHDFEISRVSVDRFGRVNPTDVERALRPETTLVSVMLANNEVGTIQPIAALAALAHAVGAPMHTDAVQAAGWLDLTLGTLGVDALTLAGHKIGAAKGIGLLALRAAVPLEPLIHGGGQQRGARAGTENVAGAVGIAVALEKAHAARHDRERSEPMTGFINDVLKSVPSAQLTGHPTLRLPSIASFTFAGVSGEAILIELERRGIRASSGSACAAGSDEPSKVLTAMGISPELAHTAVRFSLDAHTSTTTPAHTLAVVSTVLAEIVADLTADLTVGGSAAPK